MQGELKIRKYCNCYKFKGSKTIQNNTVHYRTTTVGFLGAEKELQRFRGVRGQDDATETGRRATS